MQLIKSYFDQNTLSILKGVFTGATLPVVALFMVLLYFKSTHP